MKIVISFKLSLSSCLVITPREQQTFYLKNNSRLLCSNVIFYVGYVEFFPNKSNSLYDN